MEPERFPKTPLDAVPLDCSADGPRDGKAQARAWFRFPLRPLETERGEEGTGNSEAVVIDPTEVGLA
jgi:hypothetical protein